MMMGDKRPGDDAENQSGGDRADSRRPAAADDSGTPDAEQDYPGPEFEHQDTAPDDEPASFENVPDSDSAGSPEFVEPAAGEQQNNATARQAPSAATDHDQSSKGSDATDTAGTSSPWPARIAITVVVVAIVAIIAALILPRQHRTVEPDIVNRNARRQQQQKTTDGASAAHSRRRVTERRTVPRSNGASESQSTPSRRSANRAASTSESSSRPRRIISRIPEAERGSSGARRASDSETQQHAGTGGQRRRRVARGRQSSGPSDGQTNDTSSSGDAGRGERGSRRETARPAGGSGRRQRSSDGIFSRRRARQIVDEAAAQETAARNRALRLFVAELRKPRYQNPQLYAMLAGTVQTSGPALVPGGASEGHKEIFDIIASSRTGAEAANRLEQMGYESALPAPVQEALVGVLASATGVQQVLNGIRNVEAQYDTQLAPGTVAKIKQNAQRAVQQRRNTSPRR